MKRLMGCSGSDNEEEALIDSIIFCPRLCHIMFLRASVVKFVRRSARLHDQTHLFSSRFSAKKWWKNGPLGPCKGLFRKGALALVAHARRLKRRAERLNFVHGGAGSSSIPGYAESVCYKIKRLTDMTENWKSYFCNVNSKLASIALNLSLNEDAPIKSKPWLMWVWVYLQHPRPDGLSSQTEFETISAIEDALLECLISTCQAVEPGRITTDGRREFYFYGESTDGFEASIRAVMGGFSSYKFDLGKQHEPDWNQYRNVLYPSKESMQQIKNMDVLELLENHGDTLESVRDVHHWIYFKTSNDRKLFAEDVLQLGYTVEGQLEGLEKEFPYSIQITRDQSVTPGKIDDAVLELFRLAKELDGEYDGWEAQVVATKN